ncbi:unnamed protein product [Urochloa humidicola]
MMRRRSWRMVTLEAGLQSVEYKELTQGAVPARNEIVESNIE